VLTGHATALLGVQKKLAGHFKQLSSEMAPSVPAGMYLPAGQSLHCSNPMLILKEPTGHAAHVLFLPALGLYPRLH
jgi:hypothetical protein